jgi:hypothetical protein
MLNFASFEQLAPSLIVRVEGCARCAAEDTVPRDFEVTTAEVTFRYQLCTRCLQAFASSAPAQTDAFWAEIAVRIERAMDGLLCRAQGGLRCGSWTQ